MKRRMNRKGEVCTMLSGHNWVTNGSYLQRQISYKSDIGGSDYTAQESARKGVFNDVEKKSVTFGNSSGETTQKTTQKVIQNIKVNNLHANCMQIARKNQYLPMIVRGYRETEPQMNADWCDKKVYHELPCASPSIWGNSTMVCANGNVGV